MARRWHVEHADGSRWTKGELTKIIHDEREHDDLCPFDADLFALTIDMDCTIFLIDNCMNWHLMDETDDMVVMWDE